MQGTRAAYVAYRKGRLISWWSNTIPAISQPQEGQLYGWLPLSNAYGIYPVEKQPISIILQLFFYQKLVLHFFLEKLLDLKTFSIFATMKAERKILAYKNYFSDFIQSLNDAEARKVFYVIDMLKTQERVNAKFVKYLRDEIFEIRAEHGRNIFRVFFIFDDGNVVMLFNGFQKKTQKTPEKEIDKAIQLKKEYYAEKK